MGISLTILLVAAAHAVPIFVTAAFTRNVAVFNVVAAITLIIAVFVGSPAFILFDVVAVAIAYASCRKWLELTAALESGAPEHSSSQSLQGEVRTQNETVHDNAALDSRRSVRSSSPSMQGEVRTENETVHDDAALESSPMGSSGSMQREVWTQKAQYLIASIEQFEAEFQAAATEAAVSTGLREIPPTGEKFLAILIGAIEALSQRVEADPMALQYATTRYMRSRAGAGRAVLHGSILSRISEDPNWVPWIYLAKHAVTSHISANEDSDEGYSYLATQYIESGGG